MRAFFKQLYYFTEIWTSVNIIDSDQILHGATPGTDLHCLPYKFSDLVKNKGNKNSLGQTVHRQTDRLLKFVDLSLFRVNLPVSSAGSVVTVCRFCLTYTRMYLKLSERERDRDRER